MSHYEYAYDESSGYYRQLTATDHHYAVAAAVVFASDAHAALLSAASPVRYLRVGSPAELREVAKHAQIAFIDCDLFDQIDVSAIKIPIVGIIRDTPGTVLPSAVRLLNSFPQVSHFVTATMLASELAPTHLAMFVERLSSGRENDMIGHEGVGRVALLARASHREQRLARMHDFYSNHGLTARTISAINGIVEELVTNALYDAPSEAGFFNRPVSRTEDVDLPPDRACEIVYGIEGGHVFLRIRDSFGALTRARLLHVLNRCNTAGVQLDESRGGAGLGMWRVLSGASTIAITVVPGKLTEVLVGISTKQGRIVAKQLLALHLFIDAHGEPSGPMLDAFVPFQYQRFLDQSITLVRVT